MVTGSSAMAISCRPRTLSTWIVASSTAATTINSDAALRTTVAYLIGLVAIWFGPETMGRPLPE